MSRWVGWGPSNPDNLRAAIAKVWSIRERARSRMAVVARSNNIGRIDPTASRHTAMTGCIANAEDCIQLSALGVGVPLPCRQCERAV